MENRNLKWEGKTVKKGFTLLELLIVIMVITILIGIALPRFRGMQEEGNIAKAKGELRTLQIAVESYYMHNSNTYPGDTMTVAGPLLIAATPNIIGTAIPDDPFSATDYVYVNGGTDNKYYIIYSVGPGGDGAAEISVTDTVSETNPESCIYVSNMSQDSQP